MQLVARKRWGVTAHVANAAAAVSLAKSQFRVGYYAGAKTSRNAGAR